MIGRDPFYQAPSVRSFSAFSLPAAQNVLDEPSHPSRMLLRKMGGLTIQNAPRAPQP